ncbi:ethylene overproducer1-like protein [Klebsormidium nitens]|uniref:Ethylene overproducer1-like protein n=1 Tax=Klebsormidium nitens TaxID=105231 RepID=A0A1Y1I015_KLENI|nr:ethylene overproducer1-like protein [Klebsormidium nitens]|eukprot:GAQ82116.1 ethylene overproducer1-like protein [Klebsormidium nitens]
MRHGASLRVQPLHNFKTKEQGVAAPSVLRSKGHFHYRSMTRLGEPLLGDGGMFLSTNYVDDLATIQEQLDGAHSKAIPREDSEADGSRALLYSAQALLFDGLGEGKLMRQSLESARRAALDERQKLVFDSWAKFQSNGLLESSAGLLRRQSRSASMKLSPDEGNEEVAGAEVSGDRCRVCNGTRNSVPGSAGAEGGLRTGESEESRQRWCIPAAEDVVLLTVAGQFVACSRSSLAELSAPFNAMLLGQYQESRKTAIPFDLNGLSPAGLQAVERFSRTGSLEERPGATCERWLCGAGNSACALRQPAVSESSGSHHMSDAEWQPSAESSDEEESDTEDEEKSISPRTARRVPVSNSELFAATTCEEWPQERPVASAHEPLSDPGSQTESSKDATRLDSTESSSLGRGMRRMVPSKALRSEFSGGFGKGMKIRVGSNGDLKALDDDAQACALSCVEAGRDQVYTDLVVEVLLFASRFCCEGLKAHCDERLAKMVNTSEEAVSNLAFALEESCPVLTTRCLKLLLERMPRVLITDPTVAELLLSKDGRRQLQQAGFASFAFYFFLAHTLFDSIFGPLACSPPFRKSRAVDLASACLRAALTFPSPAILTAFAHYRIGCLDLLSKNLPDAKAAFEAAVMAGYAPARAGLARILALQGDRLGARQEVSRLLSSADVAAGWIFQERAICSDGGRRREDLETATMLCPTLTYPYKHRATRLLKEGKPDLARAELDRALRFMVTPDLLEFRAYCAIVLQDFEAVARDLRVLLTLEPQYLLYGGRVSGAQFLKQLAKKVAPLSKGDCWLRLYERWSAVDDIGSLAVVHRMLELEPGSSAILFRQSLLLHRIGCSDVTMRTLRAARDHSRSEHERLIYEGWILFDTGRRAEAFEKAQMSVSLAPSFEGYFLQAYALSDSSLTDHSPGSVIELLHKALNCPSDGLRKGQALSNLGSMYVDCGRYREAAECFTNALRIRHTRAHQGLARVHAMQGNRERAYEEMTKLIKSAQSNSCAFEKRSEYGAAGQGLADLDTVTRVNPLRSYPYRYRAAVMMDTLREREAIQELSRAIAFKVDVSLLHLRAEFHECQADLDAARRDARAALAIDPNHVATQELWKSKLDLSNARRPG